MFPTETAKDRQPGARPAVWAMKGKSSLKCWHNTVSM